MLLAMAVLYRLSLNESLSGELLSSDNSADFSEDTPGDLHQVVLALLASRRAPASDFSTSLMAPLLGLVDEKPSGEREAAPPGSDLHPSVDQAECLFGVCWLIMYFLSRRFADSSPWSLSLIGGTASLLFISSFTCGIWVSSFLAP